MRSAALFGVVTLGLSQIVFNLILNNRTYFPERPAFHLWVLLWMQALPWVLVAGIDLFARRGERAFRLWRAFLYAAFCLSFLRQVQVYYPGLVRSLPGALPAAYFVAGVGGPILFYRKNLHGFAALLSIPAAFLTLVYASQTLLQSESSSTDSDAPEATGPPVVFLVFDELSSQALLEGDRIDPVRFPNLARLSGESAWFPGATANFQWTKKAIPCLLTGRLRPADEDPLIFESLPAGYRMTFINAWLDNHNWLRRRLGGNHRHYFRSKADQLVHNPLEAGAFLSDALLASPFVRAGFGGSQDEHLRPPQEWEGRGTHLFAAQEVESCVEAIREGGGAGTLLYWHSSLPHSPYVYDREGKPHGRAHMTFLPKGLGAAETMENYVEQVRYVDAIVGRIVDTLERAGVYDKVLFVVTSDHGVRTGEGFEPEGYPEVRGEWVTGIPVFIRAPGLRTGRWETEFQSMDLVPTILDLLHLPFDPERYEGRSALSSAPPPRPKVFWDGNSRFRFDDQTGLWRLQ